MKESFSLLLISILFSCQIHFKETNWSDQFFSYKYFKTNKDDIKNKYSYDIYDQQELEYYILNIYNKQEMRMNEAAGSIFNIQIDIMIRKLGAKENYSSAKIIEQFKNENLKNFSAVDSLVVFSKNNSDALAQILDYRINNKTKKYNYRLYSKSDFEEYGNPNIIECREREKNQVDKALKEKYPSGIPEDKKRSYDFDIYFELLKCYPWIRSR